MLRQLFLCVLVVLQVVSKVSTAAEVNIQCRTVWGDGHGDDKKMTVLDVAQINDGYCDCLETGIDETETEACSGLATLFGINVPSASENPHQKSTPVSFQCPQQPELQIPMSHVHDGVCDCCDGADEVPGICTDDCAAIFAAQEQAKKELQQRYLKGSEKRQQALRDYIDFVAETKQKLESTKQELDKKQTESETAQKSLGDGKAVYMQARVTRMQQQYLTLASRENADFVSGLLEGMTVSELKALLVHSCQVAGEIEQQQDDDHKKKTCVPLRLAGLDVGAVWEPGTYRLRRLDDDKVDEVDSKPQLVKSLSEILYHNSHAEDDDDIVWRESGVDGKNKKKRKNKPRRRLMSVAAAEEYDYDDYDDYDDYHYHEDYQDEEDMYDDYESSSKGNHEEDNDDDEAADQDKRAELTNKILKANYSGTRASYLTKAKSVLLAIEEATKEPDNSEVEGEEKDGSQEAEGEASKEGESENEAEEQPLVDAIDYPIVRNALEKKKKIIEVGLDYAVSAEVLLDSAAKAFEGKPDDEFKQFLYQVAIGTLNHGRVSAVQFYEILSFVVSDLQRESDTQTCSSPWASICPPRMIQRSSSAVPPIRVIKAVEAFCTSKSSSDEPAPGVCSNAEESESAEIPSNVPDGYFGYYVAQSRTEDDILSEAFRELGFDGSGDDDHAAHSNAVDLEERVDALETDVKNLEKQRRDLEDSIGGDDPLKFGPDGELHAFRDQCFDVEAGKYVYELCPFGSAAQKDVGSKGHGTDLGKWKEATTETLTDEAGREYEQRIWKWENGAKCWNGPHRSATAYVTCGAETRVWSADEPDTCRYVMEMESPIACDEGFRVRHNL